MNGDLYSDLLISALFSSPYARSGAGIVYVVYGGLQPFCGNISDLSVADGLRILGENSSSHLGQSMSAGFDVNNDGNDDFLLTAPMYSEGVIRPSCGAMYMYYGGASSVLEIDLLHPPANLIGKVIGAVTNEAFGWSVAHQGRNSDAFIVASQRNVYLFLASTLMLNATTFDAEMDSVMCLSGTVVPYYVASSGDVSGDLVNDYVICTPFYNAGIGRSR